MQKHLLLPQNRQKYLLHTFQQYNQLTYLFRGHSTDQNPHIDLPTDLHIDEASLYQQISNNQQHVQPSHIQLHQPLRNFLPEDDPVWRGKIPSWLDEVTLHQLLCHTSGIPNYTADPSFNSFSKVDHNSVYDVVELFSCQELEFTPGSKWNYSNSGYILLGFVVERISGFEIEEYFEKNIFYPVGMKSTFMPSKGRVSDLKEERPNLARGYAWDLFDVNAPLKEQPMYENMIHAHAAGAIISSVEDLHRWNIALYENAEVLPKFLVDLMLEKHALIDPEATNVFYSYGLSIQQEPELPLIGHHGGIPGYFSVLHYYPRRGITLVVLQNVTGNAEQQVALQEELQKKFGELGSCDERYRLEDEYLKENYPEMFQQEKTHNFAMPLIEFFEKC